MFDQDMLFAIGDEELEQGLRPICIGSPFPTWCSTHEHTYVFYTYRVEVYPV
jgi:hypothetical protein